MTSDASVPTPATARPSASGELRATALDQFASVGFAGTSLQQIADAAGYSKSSVLYHFASKEALLEEVLTPAIDRLEAILERFLATAETVESRRRFVNDFIDFILEFRLELHTFINQSQSLRGIPVIDRAGVLIVRLSDTLCHGEASTEDRIRFGIALGGAAYTLVAGMTFLGEEIAPVDEIRPALLAVVTELLAPVTVRTTPSRK
ncbi:MULTISPECIES: TetR/AcrR family transcriptional regulator [Cryobacterium]|uniref:TetR/AcrR family transcriptional regulator n=1 Tax=Cryobacterium breve TaxID=1259258 RepID=A0ABY2J639_9MICO|nr:MULTISPECIES: TetR/AcrR family transcriptional regulator [Cryobacterium]TFC95174.1 TetR/AcrR family transcriptional regulator [Cryobacterium sp. TmT3-12]TFD00370.1 TetR/AcrR family transcriptional regulator [Cryobacterium breve]